MMVEPNQKLFCLKDKLPDATVNQVTIMKRLKDFIGWLYLQYMLVTCGIDYEPWEQMIMHVVTATIISMLLFTAYLLNPLNLPLIFQFLQKLCVE